MSKPQPGSRGNHPRFDSSLAHESLLLGDEILEAQRSEAQSFEENVCLGAQRFSIGDCGTKSGSTGLVDFPV